VSGQRSALPTALLIACAILAAGRVAGSPRVIEARPLDTFPRERIAVETRSARRIVFEAWRADTYDTRAQGLMFVEELAPSQAMIFIYDPPQQVSMWMKNTYVPLDMLFADRSGCIVTVVANTKPLSLDSIVGSGPVAYVVEIKAGTAAAHGIARGDRVVRFESDPPPAHRLPCTHG
jgi:uncharacterized membrane protein (UPF0127 family)